MILVRYLTFLCELCLVCMISKLVDSRITNKTSFFCVIISFLSSLLIYTLIDRFFISPRDQFRIFESSTREGMSQALEV